jgi:hypothetical protein
MAIPEALIGAGVGLVSGIIKIVGKKKPNALWYQGVLPTANVPNGIWLKKAGPMSARQCRKTRNALVGGGGYELARFMIVREGVNPNK